MTAPVAAPPPEFIPAVGPDGKIVEVSSADAASGQAAADGFRPPTPEEWAHFQGVQGASTLGQQVLTGVEGFRRGLAGPIPDAIDQFMGYTTGEDKRLRKEANPGTEIGGQLAGFVTGAALSGGANAEASGAAKMTLPGLLESAGKGAGNAVKGVVGEGALGKALTAGANFGAQGALMGASDVGVQAVTGDPNLTAESALAHVGGGALLGGLLGTGGKALSQMVPEGVTDKMLGWLGEVAGTRGLKSAGAIQGDLNRSLKTMSREDLNALGQRAVENGWIGPLSTPAQTFERTAAAMDEAGGKMGDLLGRASASPKAPTFDWDDIRKAVNADVLDPLREKAATLPAVRQAEKVLEDYSQVYGERTLTLKDLHSLRRDLDSVIYQHGRSIDPFAKAVSEPLKGVRDLVSDRISAGIDEAGLASQEWRALNGAYRDARVVNRFAEKGMLRNEGNNLLSLTETMGGLTGLATNGLSGGVVGALGSAALRRHSSGLAAVAATRAQKLLASFADSGIAGVASSVARVFGSTAAKASSEAAERLLTPANYRTVADNLREHSASPDRLASSVNSQTAVLQGHAPEVASAMAGVAARAVPYLASKLPAEGERSVLGPPYKPSSAELAPFNRAAAVANRPTSVLDRIADGTVHPDHIAALRSIYPALHKEMTVQIMEKLSQVVSGRQTVPFQTRMGLAVFLGGDLDPMLSQQSMAANQAAISAGVQQEAAAGMVPAPRSTENLNVAGRMATPMQASASRSA